MDHNQHTMNMDETSSFFQRFKMSMSMTMGMDHSGLSGRAMAKMMELDIRRKFFFSLILAIPILLYSPFGENLLHIHLPSPIPVSWTLFILTTPVYFYAGWIFLYSSYHALKKRTLNMAVLIAVGITAAYAFSVFLTVTGGKDSFYEAAAMLITFVLFGHWMEMKSRRGTTDSLQALFDLVPPKARLLRNGKETLVATSVIKLGDILILKPGDKIPVDGTITTGETLVDEALVTGESLPVVKSVGDRLIAGSINDSGSVRFSATKVGNDTALAQIIKMVETAQNSKAPGQRLADRFAGYLVIIAISAGLLTFVVWMIAGFSVIFALTLAISAIVIACPDALGLATPTAVAVGTGMGARHNILIKDASTLEQTSKIQAVVMDKTGTLTEGKPRVTDVVTANDFTEIDILRLTAAAEISSNHPLSKAVIGAVKEMDATIPTDIKKFVSISGYGVQAQVEGKLILVGTLKLMKEKKVYVADIQSSVDTLLSQGKTLMVLAVNGKVAGVIAAQDPIKPTAKLAIERMQELGIQVAMLTGDNQHTADAIAKTLGITRVFAEVLPQDKATYVKKLQKEGLFVAMVGDGVNDAPALAQADIGIAIGAGTDVAIETAKVVLMKSDPTDILRAIRLSKATIRKMKQNLAWASVYNLAAIPIAAGVLYPAFGITLRPEVSALLMSISSIIVATNAVLLKRSEKDLITI
jgi:Cu2+-exporting ATPase